MPQNGIIEYENLRSAVQEQQKNTPPEIVSWVPPPKSSKSDLKASDFEPTGLPYPFPGYLMDPVLKDPAIEAEENKLMSIKCHNDDTTMQL